MKNLLKAEEIILFLFGIYLFAQLPYAWWWFPALLLAPDLGMLGYLAGSRTGAITYNFTHHRGVALGCYLLGVYLYFPVLQLAGTILFAHASLDRALGYGLKYTSGFAHTHLGTIGKKNG